MLTVALPSGKSLEPALRELFARCALTLGRTARENTVTFTNFDWLSTGTFVKPNRVVPLIANGHFDIGIAGSDTLAESGETERVEPVWPLDVGRNTTAGHSSVVLFGDKDDTSTVENIPAGTHIISEYPRITADYFALRNKEVVVVPTTGGAEAEVPRIYRYGVALSETGGSLIRNGLRPIATLTSCKTYLMAHKQRFATDPAFREAVTTVRWCLTGVTCARNKVLFAMNVPLTSLAAVRDIVPAMGSPTISPLADPAYVSLSIVCTQAQMNNLTPRIRALGASDFVATPLVSVIGSETHTRWNK